MVESGSSTRQPLNLWVSMIVGAVIPMLLGLGLAAYFSEWRWSHYPFHSMVESVGAISAITISVLMVMMVNHQHLPRYYIWPATALIGMGILDGAHAILHAGDAFVWLHSVATMIGGLAFAAIWLPERWLKHKCQCSLIIAITAISLLISAVAIASPGVLPAMIIEGEFTLLAKFFNIAGGVGFLLGTAFFVRHKLRFGTQHEIESHISKDQVFANHCLLFGIAGLLFESSVIWDAGWWWWHLLRLVAYLVVLVYFFMLFKQQQDTLTDNEKELSVINQDLEKRVYERTRELEEASRAKSDFLSHMSHELRTPMNAVLGFAQILEIDKDNLNETQHASVREILDAGQHLLHLINDVLDLAKIEAGRMDVKIETIDIDALLHECFGLIQSQVNDRKLTLVNELSKEGYLVKADSIRLKQVLLNLLSNAMKYNSEQGFIRVKTEVVADNKVRVSVSDTGEGMTREELDKLFVPFERLNANSTVEGAGIGLIITQYLLELMGGSVGVESTKGEGSTFWIELAQDELAVD